MKITTGKNKRAQKIVIYGPEGIGKSTFASQFPFALFSDVEGSTDELDISRFPKPSSWEMLIQQAQYLKSNPNKCKTWVIDTVDWAEALCSEYICAKSKKEGIEDFGYGKGYVYLEEEFGRFLNLCSDLLPLGINVVFTAHAQMRKFEQPDEMGAYDRWELKLEKKTAPLLKEWADAVFFANYKTYVIKTDDKKNKAQGGKRVMYTTHHSCWDAKNRYGLSEEIPFEFTQIAHCIPVIEPVTKAAPIQNAVETNLHQNCNNYNPDKVLESVGKCDNGNGVNGFVPTEDKACDNFKDQKSPDPVVGENDLFGIVKPLADLMKINNVSPKEIQAAVAQKGYYPEDTPIANYDPGFVSGVLVGAWPQVYKIIQELKKIPF